MRIKCLKQVLLCLRRQRLLMRNSAIVCLTLLVASLFAAAATASTLGAPLTLADEGSFFVGGRAVEVAYPNVNPVGLAAPGKVTVGQMYVHYWIPAKVTGLPVIMVHGANHTGVTFETTPDGREGWATYFVRHGYPVYVVDHPGRGRSGFDGALINQAKAQSNPAILPNVSVATREGGWVNFLFGPQYGVAWPDEKFPVSALDQYTAQLVPNAETMLDGGEANTVSALVSLVDKVGPSILLVHSQSGTYGMQVAAKRPDAVKAVVSVEGDCTPSSPSDLTGVFAHVPFLSLWGDHSIGAAGFNGDKRRNSCTTTVDAIKAVKGPATFTLLPDMGIHGNSHMMMMDANNLQIADIIMRWIDSVAQRR
jgi:pimeloyl-ACP methyl ester carboxylesterase